MKYLLFICLIVSIPASSLDIQTRLQRDIKATLADTKYDPVEFDIPDKPKLFQFVEYNEPPTKAQYTYFYVIHALDLITTYEGLKSNPNVEEQNIFFKNNPRPSLGELVLFKAIVIPLLGHNLSSDQMNISNAITTAAVINNYEIYH